jgi:hypothetical protein
MLLVYFNGGQLTGWAIIPCGIFMAGLVWAWMSSRETPLLDAGTLREQARYPLQIRSASMSNPKRNRATIRRRTRMSGFRAMTR